MTDTERIINWGVESDNSLRRHALAVMNYYGESRGRQDVIKDVTRYAPVTACFLKKAALVMGHPPKGTGVDLGAGTATFTAAAARYPSVEKLYAVEYSEASVKYVMPITFRELNVDPGKIVPVIGSFNTLKFDDSSLDFAMEFGAFHHSEDLPVTLREAYRVLKRGGWLISVERAWPNHVSQAILEAALDRELSRSRKEMYGIRLGESVTRRMWGEHEYRACQWMSHFAHAGFETFGFHFLWRVRRPLHWLLKASFWAVGDALLRRRFCHTFFYPWFGTEDTHGKLLTCARKP